MTVLAWAAVLLTIAVVVTVAAWCVSRARRLDRLHVRTDAARAGLVAALHRRARAAHRAARALHENGAGDDAAAAVLDRAARRALTAPEPEREDAENDLGRRLAALDHAGLPPAVAADLVDAEQLVLLARHVHNDAVRDTRTLRSRRLVRWLRLAGRAPVPDYFEIVDPEVPAVSGPTAVSRTAPAPPRVDGRARRADVGSRDHGS